MTDLNEIKKALYKEKPLAIFVSADKATLTYTCFIKEVYQLYFCIPHSDIGDAKFGFNACTTINKMVSYPIEKR